MDRISIRKLEVYANHGVFPEENKLGQKFIVNAQLMLDLRSAGVSDKLTSSIDYADVCRFIASFMTENTFKLIESCAYQLSTALLIRYDKLTEVSLEILKPWAPVGLPLESVAVSICRKWHCIYLSLGSNIGDKDKYLDNAIAMLKDDKMIKNITESKRIITKPYGNTNQADFLNSAVKIYSLYSPHELLDKLHEIENLNGRVRKERWGERTLDLDILFYDDLVLFDEDLIIPHIDMSNRKFVLEPMAEIAAGLIHPVSHTTIYEMLSKLNNIS